MPCLEMGDIRGSARAPNESYRMRNWPHANHCVLSHALREAEKAPLQAVIYIGDCMEEEIDELAAMAGKLGELGTPLFVFHEGDDRKAEKAFRLMALRSGGKYFKFGIETAHAIELLANDLNAVARLAMGDTEALKQIGRSR